MRRLGASTYDADMGPMPDSEDRHRTLAALASLRELRAQGPPISEAAIEDALAQSRAEIEDRAFGRWELRPSPQAPDDPPDHPLLDVMKPLLSKSLREGRARHERAPDGSQGFYDGARWPLSATGMTRIRPGSRRSKDAEKDRWLKGRGIRVLRWTGTGTAVHRDADACVRELMDTVRGAAAVTRSAPALRRERTRGRQGEALRPGRPRSEPRNAKTRSASGFSEERMMGLEPTTFCMASRRSSQLSYIREVGGSLPAGRGRSNRRRGPRSALRGRLPGVGVGLGEADLDALGGERPLERPWSSASGRRARRGRAAG